MAKKFFTQSDIQNILEQNTLGAPVTYADREKEINLSTGNAIVFNLLAPPSQPYADDQLHLITYQLQVVHFHKKKLDSIAQLMKDQFNVVFASIQAKDTSTDWISTYYQFDIFTNGDW